MSFVCSAWNSGKLLASGAGYGFKVPSAARDIYFKKEWKSIILEFPVKGSFLEVSLNVDKPSFWNETCHELISKEIGHWLRSTGRAPWPSGKPPKFVIELVSEKRFKVIHDDS